MLIGCLALATRCSAQFGTSGIECMLDLYPPQTTYAMCTIAQRPRLPEHCVMYAKLILWPREKKDEPIDGDDPDHIRWLFEQVFTATPT